MLFVYSQIINMTPDFFLRGKDTFFSAFIIDVNIRANSSIISSL